MHLPLPANVQQRSAIRDDIDQVISELTHVEEAKTASSNYKKHAEELAKKLGNSVEYAPVWVRILSALCLGIGTMIGYKRIFTTLGERLGNVHLTPAQGATAELVSAALIGTAGFTGLPVSTTHIVTSGIAGTMVGHGAWIAVRGPGADRTGMASDAAGYDHHGGPAVLPAGQPSFLITRRRSGSHASARSRQGAQTRQA